MHVYIELDVISTIVRTLLFLSLVGIVADWKHPQFIDMRFAEHAASFEAALAGQEVVIPINPNWEMRLVKK